MMSITSPRFRLPEWPSLSGLLRRVLPSFPPINDADADADRARRDFVLDMLDRHPEAFASEFDVQGMLSLYRDRF
ncbi:MAG: hypothetical protein B7Z02_05190 [Rhodobacterales bacterium 32-67-9]|nr:MAG: hypothetical protein B7Z02_05190 [Rhodobacterales bacterium 32-67-9]